MTKTNTEQPAAEAFEAWLTDELFTALAESCLGMGWEDAEFEQVAFRKALKQAFLAGRAHP